MFKKPFSNVATRQFKIIQVTCICGLHFISIGWHYCRAFIFVFAGQVNSKTGLSSTYQSVSIQRIATKDSI